MSQVIHSHLKFVDFLNRVIIHVEVAESEELLKHSSELHFNTITLSASGLVCKEMFPPAIRTVDTDAG